MENQSFEPCSDNNSFAFLKVFGILRDTSNATLFYSCWLEELCIVLMKEILVEFQAVFWGYCIQVLPILCFLLMLLPKKEKIAIFGDDFLGVRIFFSSGR